MVDIVMKKVTIVGILMVILGQDTAQRVLVELTRVVDVEVCLTIDMTITLGTYPEIEIGIVLEIDIKMIPEGEIDIGVILGMYFATILEIDSEMTLGIDLVELGHERDMEIILQGIIELAVVTWTLPTIDLPTTGTVRDAGEAVTTTNAMFAIGQDI